MELCTYCLTVIDILCINGNLILQSENIHDGLRLTMLNGVPTCSNQK